MTLRALVSALTQPRARAVALLRINEHLDSAACGAAPAGGGEGGQKTQRRRESSVASPAAAPPPPLLPAPAPLVASLRWRADAAPAARRYGQHTGRAAGVLPPAPPPPSASDALRSLLSHANDDAPDDDDDAFRDLFRDADDPAAAAPARAPAPPLHAAAPPALLVQRTYGLGGHLVIEDILSAEEEAALLAAVDGAQSPPWVAQTYNGRGRGKAWGVAMDLA
jgi:hypothetical protein